MSTTEVDVVEQQRALVERLMDRTGLSLSALATAADMSPSTLTRWWRERSTLRPETIARLMAVSPEREESALDRPALISALTLVHEAMGLPAPRARAAAIAATSMYRRSALGDEFSSPDEARRAAELALETAESMIALE